MDNINPIGNLMQATMDNVKNMLKVEPPVIPLLTKVMLRIIATTMKARKGTGVLQKILRLNLRPSHAAV